MRSILVDWLVEVAEEYKLSPQTLFLTVSPSPCLMLASMYLRLFYTHQKDHQVSDAQTRAPLFAQINYIDRILGLVEVNRSKLQLLVRSALSFTITNKD